MRPGDASTPDDTSTPHGFTYSTADATFSLSAPGEYPFICSFPGHYMLMKGTLTVK